MISRSANRQPSRSARACPISSPRLPRVCEMATTLIGPPPRHGRPGFARPCLTSDWTAPHRPRRPGLRRDIMRGVPGMVARGGAFRKALVAPIIPGIMERRRLGRTDMQVSVLGFGGSEIGYQGVSRRTVARLLGSALDAGLNVVDTAECYEDSEALIGAAVGRRRDEFHLFTKCGHAAGWGRADWRAGALVKSLERSLERLRTDRVDLFQLHSCSL